MILEIRNKITDTICKVECNESGTPLIDNWKPVIVNGEIVTEGVTFINSSGQSVTPNYSDVYEVL